MWPIFEPAALDYAIVDLHISTADFDEPLHQAAIIKTLDSYAADPIGGGEPLSADVRARLVPGLKAQANSLVLLAFDDAEPVGVAICFYGFSSFKARSLLNVHDLAVIPERRGQGAGRALLAAAEDHARKRGCCKLTLEVQDGNTGARRLYERVGFRDYALGDSNVTRFLEKPLAD
jgi:ribosomal protein S18 acetylase RimI-like enzyme